MLKKTYKIKTLLTLFLIACITVYYMFFSWPFYGQLNIINFTKNIPSEHIDLSIKKKDTLYPFEIVLTQNKIQFSLINCIREINFFDGPNDPLFLTTKYCTIKPSSWGFYGRKNPNDTWKIFYNHLEKQNNIKKIPFTKDNFFCEVLYEKSILDDEYTLECFSKTNKEKLISKQIVLNKTKTEKAILLEYNTNTEEYEKNIRNLILNK